MRTYSLSHLGDAELLRALASAIAHDRVSTATVLAHIAETDARRLYLPEGGTHGTAIPRHLRRGGRRAAGGAECAFGAESMRHKRDEARRRAEARRQEIEARRAEGARQREAAARAHAAVEEVIAPLRSLGFRADEARCAAALCESTPGAPLEERVRVALSYFHKPRHRTTATGLGTAASGPSTQ